MKPFKTGDKIIFRHTVSESATTRRVRFFLGILEHEDQPRTLSQPDRWWILYGRGHRRSVPITDISHRKRGDGYLIREWVEPKSPPGHG